MRAVLLIVLAVSLMVMDRRWESFASIRTALTLPIAPIQFVISWPTRFVGNLKTVLSTHDDLVKQNLQLKSDQLLLQSQLQRLLAIESENNYLKALMKSSRQLKSKTLIAEVLAVESEPYANQVVLNKGKRDGVYVGQSVFDASGVMGQVVQAGLITSRVILINDIRSGVAVQNARNGMRSVALGDGGSGKLRLQYVAQTADIRVGDTFITSGLGGQYPEGYPVGKVLTVTNDAAKQFVEVYLQPSAHLDSSRQVLLVWYHEHV